MKSHSALLLGSLISACAGRSPRAPAAPSELAVAESLYADVRDTRDLIDVVLAQIHEVYEVAPITGAIQTYNRLRREAAARLAALDSAALQDADRSALGAMRQAMDRQLDSVAVPWARQRTFDIAPSCAYDPSTIVTVPRGVDSLRKRIYACYGWAQSHVQVGADTLDRLTILGSLGRTESAVRRRELFLALEPVWRSMNGDNSRGSPYRTLIAEEIKQQKGSLPSLAQARASGLPPDSLESWLLRMLETWRQVNPDSLVEPWDWYYRTGQASRALSPRISRERLIELNAEVYQSLGADVRALQVNYDLDPEPGKTPVAYTTFGKRPRFMNGAWRPAEPWVFATYRSGGLDNLAELLHETGHAVHIAAIRTRPAFADWPDSDVFTEAVADFVALEIAEPDWQQRWLGDSVPLAQGLRARYSSIVMDVAWALLELRMQRNPALDPNQVWTTLTRDYLRIRPHAELSWWAMRGQLVDAPGYMMNYAAGAMLIAAIRARTQELHGAFSTGDTTWYGWIAPRLFRFGLERPSREVIEEFLGGPVTPTAILADMRRASR